MLMKLIMLTWRTEFEWNEGPSVEAPVPQEM